jgi:predicted dehydrogenase
VLSLTGGAQATVSGTFVARGFETAQEGLITIVGSDGTLRYGEDRRVRLHRDGETKEIAIPEMTAVDCAFTLDHFLECMATGRGPETDLEDNLKTFQVVLAALESDESGRRVRVEGF